MSTELVGPLKKVWFSAGLWPREPRYYDLPKNTRDLRHDACIDHHPACDCREAMIAESFAEYKAELDALYNAVLEAVKDHPTYARNEEDRCKCQACGIARKARVGYFEQKRQREEAAEKRAREVWLRANRATLAPVHPCYDIEVPF